MDKRWVQSIENACAYYDHGCSCSQSILTGFCSHWGLPSELALKIAAPFGGGMGRLGEVCGAVSGALMVIGLRIGPAVPEDIEAKEAAAAMGRVFAERFKAERGTILCRELLSCDISQEEILQMARDTGVFKRTCPQIVRDAAEILAEMLDEM